MKEPTRTQLLVMRAYIDAILNPEGDVYWHVSGLRCAAAELIGGSYWHRRYEELAEKHKQDPRESENPETRALIAAVDRWNAKAEWKHLEGQMVERNRHDEMMAELQGQAGAHGVGCGCEYCGAPLVGRSGTFAAAYDALEEQMQAMKKEDE